VVRGIVGLFDPDGPGFIIGALATHVVPRSLIDTAISREWGFCAQLLRHEVFYGQLLTNALG
jgi:hypothetical protein